MIYKRTFNFLKITAVFLVSIFLLTGCFEKSSTGPASLLFYGLDDTDVIQPFVSAYKKTHQTVSITYKKFDNLESFENLIINEMAEGQGPDIFYVHNTWLPRHIKKLVPLVSETLTPSAFSDVFVGVVADDFIQPDPSTGISSIYALPLYVDTLALYYNKDEFERVIPERGKPAQTWEGFKQDAELFSSFDENRQLTHGAVALGRSDNIKLAVDILYNFFVQSGPLYASDFKKVEFPGDAQKFFDYFLSFGSPLSKNLSWDSNATDEVTAFLSGKVASMFGYSGLAGDLSDELKSARSKAGFSISADAVGVAPSPQISENVNENAVFANYYGVGVSRNSRNPAAAWDFLQFMGSKSNTRDYLGKTKRPTARRDLIEEQRKEPLKDVFVSQLGYAKSFHVFSDREFSSFLKEAVMQAVNGKNPRQALADAAAGMNELMQVEAPQGLYPPIPKVKK